MTKADIRILSRKLNVPTYNKPSFACLASRFAYGQTITTKKLSNIEKAEEYLMKLGFRQVRVRMHPGNIARIEVGKEQLKRFYSKDIAHKAADRLKKLGFTYVTLDLRGYRTGSMNENL
jgi:uncharacterized protein